MDPANEFHSPYVYVGGDPVNLVDPDGRQSTSVTIATEQHNRAVVNGEMSHAEHRARRKARAQGARIGIEMLADTAGDLFEFITGYTVTLDEGNRGAVAAALGLTGVSSHALKSLTQILENVRVKSFGEVVYEGTVDLEPTIRRIDAGEKHPHRNGATEFYNDEGLLQSRSDGHYREYVHPTPSVDGVGPQRIVIGKDGEAFYTPDHYDTFIPLHRPNK